jgi:glycosyltransferase involved in cell wall biosynthesis
MSEVETPLRIAMVVRLYSPWIGGTERQAAKLSAAFAAAGHEPTVITGRWFRNTPALESEYGFTVARLPTLYEFFGIRGLRKLGGYLFIVTLFMHLIRHRRDYDVVHVHGLNYHTYASVKACRISRTPILVKLANSGKNSDIKKMEEDRQLKFASRLLSTALGCDRFVALNSLVVDELVEAGVDESRIVRSSNGVDVVERLQEAEGPIRVIYVGRLHPQKSLPDLVHAVAEVAKTHHTIDCRFVGEGPEQNGLESLAVSLGLGDRLTLHGRSDDVANELRQAHIFVLPSAVEGMSNALLEAMSAGLAVIASDIPGNRDVVTHDHDGLLFPHGDIAALSAAIDSLVMDASYRQRLGAAAHQTVMERYAMDVVADCYIDLYRDLIGPTSTDAGMEASGV